MSYQRYYACTKCPPQHPYLEKYGRVFFITAEEAGHLPGQEWPRLPCPACGELCDDLHIRRTIWIVHGLVEGAFNEGKECPFCKTRTCWHMQYAEKQARDETEQNDPPRPAPAPALDPGRIYLLAAGRAVDVTERFRRIA